MLFSSSVRSRVNMTPYYQKLFGPNKDTPTYLKGKNDIWKVRGIMAWWVLSASLTFTQLYKFANGTMVTKQR